MLDIVKIIVVSYSKSMIENEKTSKTVNLYPSTYELITKNKGVKSVSLFIDEAVKCYLKYNGDDLFLKIQKELEEIKHVEHTNLGILCEVLKKAGVLDENGEVSALPKKI